MALTSVQVYSVNANGVLAAIPNFIFQTDSTGSAILGGCCSNIEYTNSYPNLEYNAQGYWVGPYQVGYGNSAIIGGGSINCIVDGQASFIGAGQNNYISGQTTVFYRDTTNGSNTQTENFGAKSFIGAGTKNTICSPKSAIVGGHGNSIIGTTCYYGIPIFTDPSYSPPPQDEYYTGNAVFMGAGFWRPDQICFGAGYNVIAGGKNNNLNGIFSVIGGGLCNSINSERGRISDVYGNSYPGQLSGQYNFIGGGFSNQINNSCTASIVGGNNNEIDKSNNSSILGGCNNIISGGNTSHNSLAGGLCNRILGGAYQFMGGGWKNLISGASYSALIGGAQNQIVSDRIWGREVAPRIGDSLNVIVGGDINLISGCLNVIVGGSQNIIKGRSNNILAGSVNQIINVCNSTILAGYKTCAIHSNSTIIGDYIDRSKTSAGPHTLTLDFASGIVLRSQCIPLTSSSNGLSGQIAIDSNYFYSHNGVKWRRTALSEW